MAEGHSYILYEISYMPKEHSYMLEKFGSMEMSMVICRGVQLSDKMISMVEREREVYVHSDGA